MLQNVKVSLSERELSLDVWVILHIDQHILPLFFPLGLIVLFEQSIELLKLEFWEFLAFLFD
jgi:hypothetical protein